MLENVMDGRIRERDRPSLLHPIRKEPDRKDNLARNVHARIRHVRAKAPRGEEQAPISPRVADALRLDEQRKKGDPRFYAGVVRAALRARLHGLEALAHPCPPCAALPIGPSASDIPDAKQHLRQAGQKRCAGKRKQNAGRPADRRSVGLRIKRVERRFARRQPEESQDDPSYGKAAKSSAKEFQPQSFFVGPQMQQVILSEQMLVENELLLENREVRTHRPYLPNSS